MDKKQFLDITGLQNYDSQIKSELLLRKNYDLTKQSSKDANLVGNITWDESKNCYSFEGTIKLYIPRTASLNVFLFINEFSSDAGTITIQDRSWITPLSCSYWIKDVEYFEFTCSEKTYIRRIIIEETSYKIPTKVSELENDKGYVSGTVTGETLTLSI